MKQFVDGYIECALWADEPCDDTGAVLENEGASLELTARLTEDATRFYEANAATVAAAIDECPKLTLSLAGHDFWLTRNGHGAGYWDGDWPEPHASALTAAAKAFGEMDLYLGDDGHICC